MYYFCLYDKNVFVKFWREENPAKRTSTFPDPWVLTYIFIATFDQINVSIMNKSVNFYRKTKNIVY